MRLGVDLALLLVLFGPLPPKLIILPKNVSPKLECDGAGDMGGGTSRSAGGGSGFLRADRGAGADRCEFFVNSFDTCAVAKEVSATGCTAGVLGRNCGGRNLGGGIGDG